MANQMSSSVRGVKQALLQESTALQTAAAATGNGTAARPKTSQGSIIVYGTFVGTVTFEGSMDGTNYAIIGTAVTIPGVTAITTPCSYIRARVSAYTSGAINAVYFE